MEVLNDNAAILSNYEVFCLCRDINQGINGQRKPGKDQKQLATITYETFKYLENTPAAHQTPELVLKFGVALDQFKLKKAEHLQLLNHRPTSGVEIQLLVEESEERLNEDQVNDLLEVIKVSLPLPQDGAQNQSQINNSDMDAT